MEFRPTPIVLSELLVTTTKAVLKPSRASKLLKAKVVNQSLKNSELWTDFWFRLVCKKLGDSGSFNCSLDFGQDADADAGQASMTTNVGDVFDVDRKTPTHFTFLPGEARTTLAVGEQPIGYIET